MRYKQTDMFSCLQSVTFKDTQGKVTKAAEKAQKKK